MTQFVRSLLFKQSNWRLQASLISGFRTQDAAVHGYSKPKEAPMSAQISDDKPTDWKSYEDFAAGIATNRLPNTDRLAGSNFRITLSDGTDRTLKFVDGKILESRFASGPHFGTSNRDGYEAIDVAKDVVFIDTLFQSRPRSHDLDCEHPYPEGIGRRVNCC